MECFTLLCKRLIGVTLSDKISNIVVYTYRAYIG